MRMRSPNLALQAVVVQSATAGDGPDKSSIGYTTVAQAARVAGLTGQTRGI